MQSLLCVLGSKRKLKESVRQLSYRVKLSGVFYLFGVVPFPHWQKNSTHVLVTKTSCGPGFLFRISPTGSRNSKNVGRLGSSNCLCLCGDIGRSLQICRSYLFCNDGVNSGLRLEEANLDTAAIGHVVFECT